MNIIGISGSPRKGNTEYILRRMLVKADKMDCSTDLVLLREKRIEFCDGDLECDTQKKCKIKDSMQDIYDRLERSDVLIMASPIYFENLTGMMKNFIDRLRPYYINEKLKGKKMIAIVVGDSDDGLSNNVGLKCFAGIASKLGLKLIGDIYFNAKGAFDVEKDKTSIEKIENFIENILK